MITSKSSDVSIACLINAETHYTSFEKWQSLKKFLSLQNVISQIFNLIFPWIGV
jgi:hypothetical protein